MNVKIIAFLFAILAASQSTSCQQVNSVKSEGVDISYQTFGSGTPILIINGGPGFSSEGFVPLAKEISKMGYQTIVFDQRGTGKSVLGNIDSTTITMDLMNVDIEALRKSLHIDEWIVFGHSFGGMLGSYYTAKHPERVSSLILSSSGGLDLQLLSTARDDIYSKLTPLQIDSLNYWSTRRESSEAANLKYAEIMAHAYIYDKKFVPVVADRLTQGNMAINALVWQDLNRNNFDCKKELKHFKKDVLIIQGKEDIVRPELALQARNIFSNSYMVLLDSCVHYAWLDQPKKFFSTIDLFLKMGEKKSKDLTEINKVLNNYLSSIYDTNPNIVEAIADSSLQKSGYYYSRKQQAWSYSSMTFEELKHTANGYNQKKWIPENAPKSVEIIEIKEKIAIAKVKAIWGFDYVLLSKESGNWKMNKILWQSYSEIEHLDMLNSLKIQ